MEPLDRQKCIAQWEEWISEERRARMQTVLAARTRWISVVLENPYQPHNTSAVLRTCDGYGIQNVHVIEGRNQFRTNPGVSLGSEKWLTVRRWRDASGDPTVACLEHLRHEGIRIVATSPEASAAPIEELSIAEPLALLIGTEETGLSKTALAMADTTTRIPMLGFTESFNLSVCVAVCLQALATRLRKSELPWTLQPEDREELYYHWLCQSLRNPKAHLRRIQQGNSTESPQWQGATGD